MTRPTPPGRSVPIGQDIIDDEDVQVSQIEESLEEEIGEAPDATDESSVPPELTGRSADTEESLGALFDNRSARHLTDGFQGGSDDDEDVVPPDGQPLPATPD